MDIASLHDTSSQILTFAFVFQSTLATLHTLSALLLHSGLERCCLAAPMRADFSHSNVKWLTCSARVSATLCFYEISIRSVIPSTSVHRCFVECVRGSSSDAIVLCNVIALHRKDVFSAERSRQAKRTPNLQICAESRIDACRDDDPRWKCLVEEAALRLRLC